MEKTTYQVPEIRNNSDQIIQAGTYGKNTAFCNSQNTGILDYINNNLEALKAISDSQSTVNDSKADKSTTYTKTEVDTIASGKVSVDTYNTKMESLDGDISALQTNVSEKVDTTTYNTKMTSLDGSIESIEGDVTTLSSQKVDKENPADSEGNTIITEADILTLEEIEASTSLADTDVASASAVADLTNCGTSAMLGDATNVNIPLSKKGTYVFFCQMNPSTATTAQKVSVYKNGVCVAQNNSSAPNGNFGGLCFICILFQRGSDEFKFTATGCVSANTYNRWGYFRIA